MKNEWDSKECFGQQAEDMLHGEPPYKCLDCDIFDKCHKITIAACLQSISTGMDLLIENGLATNKLMGFSELNKLAEIDMKKEHQRVANKSLEKDWLYLNKDFGDGIKSLTIGIIFVRPEADFFFKESQKYTKSEAMLEYDVKLDHAIIKQADKNKFYGILVSRIINSLSIIEDFKIIEFDVAAFRREVDSFFQRHNTLL